MSAVSIATRGYIGGNNGQTLVVVDGTSIPVPDDSSQTMVLAAQASQNIVADATESVNVNVNSDDSRVTISDDPDTIIIKPGC